ncbi:MAG: type II toxin-antitoxin system VapC family toxin [Vicinamibacterales bacterium]
MGERLILETSFLIDFERENNRGIPGAALSFLEAHEEARLYITFTVAGELAAGLSLDGRARWEEFVAPFHILPFTVDTSWEYGRVYRYLKENGLLIGANDLWIAATALAYRMPVVTRNVEHYRRVPDLDVRSYT